MIIACPECATKFRVAPERIPDGGSKVRCARCKHVFRVEKPEPFESPVIEAADEEITITEQPPAEPATTAEEQDDTFAPSFSMGSEEEKEDKPPLESDFDYDQFREKESQPQIDEDFSFGSEEEDTGLAEEETPATEEPQPAEASLPPEESSEEPRSDEDDFKFDSKQDEEIGKAFTPEEEQLTTPEASQSKKSGGSPSLFRIILLLILGLLIIGGVMLYMNGPEQLEQAFRQLTSQTSNSNMPVTGNISLVKGPKGEFVNNEQTGELFVIRGEVINNFQEPRASVQVKGMIYDINGKLLTQKTIFCGNPITDQELKTLSFAKLEEMMGNQFGKELSNMNIGSGQKLPFAIVFKDLPQNLSEFSVTVTASKPAAE